MSKKLMFVSVRGKEHEWHFEFYGDPKHLQDWRDDGLEVYEVAGKIPAWVVDAGLMYPWCFFQKLFNFQNPFSIFGKGKP